MRRGGRAAASRMRAIFRRALLENSGTKVQRQSSSPVGVEGMEKEETVDTSEETHKVSSCSSVTISLDTIRTVFDGVPGVSIDEATPSKRFVWSTGLMIIDKGYG